MGERINAVDTEGEGGGHAGSSTENIYDNNRMLRHFV
jgi:hypothetical protein